MLRSISLLQTQKGSGLWWAALLFCLVSVVGCGNDAEEAEAEEAEVSYTIGEPIEDSTYAAIVVSEYGADTLYTDAFQTQYNLYLEQYPTVQGNVDQSRELRRSIIEDFVLRHLLSGEAERLGLTVDPMRVETQMSQIRARFPDEETFQQALAEEGLTEDSVRVSLLERLRQQMVPERIAEDVEEATPGELSDFREQQAEQVQVQHILFRVNGTDEEAVRTEAEAVLDTALAGEVDFAELARRYSDDGSAQLGGQLDYFSRGQMVPPFEEAAFALADSGDVTEDLVRTRYGYHIIRLTGRRTGEMPDSTLAMRMLMDQRRQEAVQEGIDELRTKATVHLNEEVVQTDLNDALELYE